VESRGEEAVGRPWEDCMPICVAGLRGALSAIEELSLHPGALLGDAYMYDQASAGVWVALVALKQCGVGLARGASATAN
jgi:hypothetical protein